MHFQGGWESLPLAGDGCPCGISLGLCTRNKLPGAGVAKEFLLQTPSEREHARCWTLHLPLTTGRRRGKNREVAHGPVGFRSENVTACTAAMALGDKKIKFLSPWSLLGQNRVRTQQLLILKKIVVDSYTTATAFGALSCTATISPLLNAQYLRADQKYLSPAIGLHFRLISWNVSREWGIEISQPGLPQHYLLDPREVPPQMFMGLRPGWDPGPGLASRQHQEIHRQRAARLLGLSERQQNRGRRRAEDWSWTQAGTKHYQTETKLRIVMQAILGEGAQHILNPHCVLGIAKYFLISKHNWPMFMILCTSYLKPPAQHSN